jgi:hypothetical protein
VLYRRILAVVLLLGIALAAFLALRQDRTARSQPTGHPDGYRFGLVAVDTARRIISFSAQVRQDTGRVITLVGLSGYPWIQEQAALTSPARLLDFQQAIAVLDWALWDSLWTGKQPRHPMLLKLGTLLPDDVISDSSLLTAPCSLLSAPSLCTLHSAPCTLHSEVCTLSSALAILHQPIRRPHSQFRLPPPSLCSLHFALCTLHSEVCTLHSPLSRLIFLGSPDFDPLVLQGTDAANCRQCPAFDQEQQVITELLRRPTGELGFRLKPHALPEPGQEITVTLQIQ